MTFHDISFVVFDSVGLHFFGVAKLAATSVAVAWMTKVREIEMLEYMMLTTASEDLEPASPSCFCLL